MRSNLVLTALGAFVLSASILGMSSASAQPQKATNTPTKPAPSATAAIVTNAADLPKVKGFDWQSATDLKISVVPGAPAVAGHPVLRLVAEPVQGPHYVAALFKGSTPKKPYRITAWVKPEAGSSLLMEVRDEVNSAGKPGAYGAVAVNLASKKVEDSRGDIAEATIESGPSGWLKASATLRPATDAILVVIYVTSGGSTHFKGDGKVALVLGGIEAKP
jgi:hypothetical protein